MLRNEVRLEHIQAEYEARERDNERFRTLRDSTMRLEYEALVRNLGPPDLDTKLYWVHEEFCEDTGNWLLEDTDMQGWLNGGTDGSQSLIWLRGIPGAGKLTRHLPFYAGDARWLTACKGKTFLAGHVIDQLRSPSRPDNRVLFAFLEHSIGSYAFFDIPTRQPQHHSAGIRLPIQ